MPEQAPSDTKNNEIEARLAELPQDVRDAILSAKLGENVHAIGQKHGLHIDQLGKLEDETMLVMLGFFEPDNFSQQISQQLNITATDGNAIAQDINNQIFLPIRASLQAFAELKKTSQTITSMPQTQPQSQPEPQVEPMLPAAHAEQALPPAPAAEQIAPPSSIAATAMTSVMPQVPPAQPIAPAIQPPPTPTVEETPVAITIPTPPAAPVVASAPVTVEAPTPSPEPEIPQANKVEVTLVPEVSIQPDPLPVSTATPTPAPVINNTPHVDPLPQVQAQTLEPVLTPVVPPPAPTQPVVPPVAPAPAPTPAPVMPDAEKMLTQNTMAKPIYKADPYREPIE